MKRFFIIVETENEIALFESIMPLHDSILGNCIQAITKPLNQFQKTVFQAITGGKEPL